MKKTETISQGSVSVGFDITKPGNLQTRSTREVLSGIADGEWQRQVEHVRGFPFNSPAQNAAKKKLPFVTWSGEFAYRKQDRLIKHSGQVGIDIDDLEPKEVLKVLSKATLDPYWKAPLKLSQVL